MREIILAATALGHFIESEYAELQKERTYPMGAYKPSTLVDWPAGKELEIEAIWGEPLRQATKAGLSAPTSSPQALKGAVFEREANSRWNNATFIF